MPFKNEAATTWLMRVLDGTEYLEWSADNLKPGKSTNPEKSVKPQNGEAAVEEPKQEPKRERKKGPSKNLRKRPAKANVEKEPADLAEPVELAAPKRARRARTKHSGKEAVEHHSCLKNLRLTDEGYAIVRNHIATSSVTELLAVMANWLCQWMGVPAAATSLETLASTATVPQDKWWATPPFWGSVPWGAQCRLGWQKASGIGLLFKNPPFIVNPALLRVQESTRDLVARVMETCPTRLLNKGDGASITCGRCSVLEMARG